MSRAAWDTVADALLNRVDCVRSADHRDGAARLTLKVFGRADLLVIARRLRPLLSAACRADRRSVRFVAPPPWPADSCGCEGCRSLGL
jgi:hypothetical protein